MNGTRSGRSDADVVVVGGGPAGAATAIGLARAGIDTIVLDRARFPRAKPCGDCLSPAATDLLERLGVLEAVVAAGPARLAGWSLRSPAGRMLTVEFPGDARGIAIERRALDAILMERVAAEGVRVMEGERVVDLTRRADGGVDGVTALSGDGERRRLRARLVVGADGLRSVVATRAGAVRRAPDPRKLSLTAHMTAIRDESVERRGLTGGRPPVLGELRLGEGLCVGLAPVLAPDRGEPESAPAATARSTGRWNVTVVADAARYRRSARAREDFFRRTVEAATRGSREFEWLDDGPRLLASGPFERPVRAVAGVGWALVGDAAGYYDPFTGQGVFHALAGGELLARRVAVELRTGVARVAFVRAWAGDHRRLTASARWLQRAIEAVVSRPRLCDFAFARLAGSPPLALALGATTGDLEPAYALLRPDRVAALASAMFARAPGEAAFRGPRGRPPASKQPGPGSPARSTHA